MNKPSYAAAGTDCLKTEFYPLPLSFDDDDGHLDGVGVGDVPLEETTLEGAERQALP